MEVPEHVRATIIGENGVERDVTVKDLSAGGAWLIVDDSFENDDIVELHMEGYGKIPARVAREFVEGIGVEFELDYPSRERSTRPAPGRRRRGRGPFLRNRRWNERPKRTA